MNQQEKQKTEKRKYIVFISYKSRYSRERKSKRWMGDSEEEWLKWAEEWLHKYMGADVYLPTEKNNFNLK